ITYLLRRDSIATLLEGALDHAVLFKEMEGAVEGFLSAARAFLRLHRDRPEIRRMRHAIRQLGVEPMMEAARLSPVVKAPRQAPRPAPVGDTGPSFGIGFAFGEINQAAIGDVIGVMRQEGLAEAALSPHRALIFVKGTCGQDAFFELARRIGGIV